MEIPEHPATSGDVIIVEARDDAHARSVAASVRRMLGRPTTKARPIGRLSLEDGWSRYAVACWAI